MGSRNLGFDFFDVSKGNLKKPDFEVLFFLLLMLRFPPILAGTKSHLDHFHQPSKSGFFKFRLHM